MKSAIKSESEIVSRLLSNMIGNSDDKINLLQIFVKLLQLIHQLIISY